MTGRFPALPRDALEAFVEGLREDGLGPVAAFDAARYDALALAAGLSPLPHFGATPSSRLALVVASSRRSWLPFLRALGRDERLRDAEHPFDRWAASCIERAAARLGRRHEVRYAWEGGARRLAMVRLAELAGLGWRSPAELLVHPELGPWLGLRAVVVVEAAPPTEATSLGDGPCASCPAPCRQALRAAMSADGEGTALRAGAGPSEGWRRWLAVRDACPVGRTWRYDEAQLGYHYTKDRRWLRSARPPDGELQDGEARDGEARDERPSTPAPGG